MTNEEMLEQIQALQIDVPLLEDIYALLEQYSHRICFVQDHLGVRDFLFLAEKGSDYHDECFVALDVPVKERDSLEAQEERLLQRYEAHTTVIVEWLTAFFEETDRILYIGIGFKDTTPTEEELASIEFSFQRGYIESRLAVYRQLRIKKFPKWYQQHALSPDVLFKRLDSKKELETAEHVGALLEKINEALEKEDERTFLRLAKEYKKCVN